MRCTVLLRGLQEGEELAYVNDTSTDASVQQARHVRQVRQSGVGVGVTRCRQLGPKCSTVVRKEGREGGAGNRGGCKMIGPCVGGHCML